LAYYHIVAADARSPRDGRFIERIGSYDPNVDPSRVVIDHNLALKWLQQGAQPTDTVHSLLSRDGILLKYHLLRKGNEVEAVQKAYAEWHKQRISKLEAKVALLTGRAREKAEAILVEERAKLDRYPVYKLNELAAILKAQHDHTDVVAEMDEVAQVTEVAEPVAAE